MSAEEWRAWRDGTYEVSSAGRVRRARAGVNTHAGRVLSTPVNSSGYRVFREHAGSGTRRMHYVHNAVAEAFIGTRPDRWQVNHIDGDKQNNVPSNLEYVSASGNARHAKALGLLHPAVGPRPETRGDGHWTKRYPEKRYRLAKGDANGARKHPERILRGEAAPASRLTEDQVRAIRKAVGQGESLSSVGRRFKTTAQNVRYICNRISWRHVS